MNQPSADASGTAPGNAPPAEAGTPAEGSASGANNAHWASGLQDEGNRALVETKGWTSKGLDDVVTSYRELESKLGKAVVPPGENATAEDRERFAKAVGRPATPDGYTFKLSAELPADMPYNEVAATKYKSWAHKYGLAPWQAQGLHDDFVSEQVSMRSATGQQLEQRVGEAHAEITKSWGAPESVGYKRNSELANRALRKLELTGELKSSGLLTPKGEITSAKLAFALAKIGEGMYAEDNLHGGPGSIENPWEAGKENMTEQAKVLRRDPALAETLIRAAGKNPADVLWKGGARRPAGQ